MKKKQTKKQNRRSPNASVIVINKNGLKQPTKSSRNSQNEYKKIKSA